MGTGFTEDGRPIPIANPTTQPYFDGAKEEKLVMQRCPRDGFFFYPRNLCPTCLGDDWEWEEVSGRGEVHAFTVDRFGHDPAMAPRAPFVIAVVELEEGPRMTAGIPDISPEEIRVGMPVQATFEHLDEATLVHFQPAG
jgi:hypothetical protein